jgi:hypothetical protein
MPKPTITTGGTRIEGITTMAINITRDIAMGIITITTITTGITNTGPGTAAIVAPGITVTMAESASAVAVSTCISGSSVTRTSPTNGRGGIDPFGSPAAVFVKRNERTRRNAAASGSVRVPLSNRGG